MPSPRSALSLAAMLVALSLAGPALVRAQGKGFDGVVKHIEQEYQGRKTRIPMLGLANFVVKIIRPAGVKSFRLAVFEDQDFTSARPSRPFDQSLRAIMPRDWQPLIRVNSSRGGTERTYIYAKPEGKDLKLLTVVLESREAVVIEVKLNPDAVARFLNDPKIMGISLAGSLRGKSSSPDPLGLLAGSRSSGGSRVSISRSGGGEQTEIGYRIDQDHPQYSLTGEKTNAMAEPEDKGARPTLEERPGTDAEGDANKSAPAAPTAPDAIRIDTKLVTMNVKAVDRAGRALSDLAREDFTVYEDGVKQELSYFDPVTAPINLVLLLDLSGSTREARPVMLNAAKKFVASLSPRDRVAVACFTRDYFVVSDFTTDRALLAERIDRLGKRQGGTAFYDAMWTTLDLLSAVKDPRKAIVVLTDGVDESLLAQGEGSRRQFDELLARVNEEDVTIYPINLNTDLAKIRARLADLDLNEQQRERILRRRLGPHEKAGQQLASLAEASAGALFTAQAETDLDGVYERVAAELRLLYSLAYSPETGSVDGRFHQINVRVNRDGVVARTRRGYVAK